MRMRAEFNCLLFLAVALTTAVSTSDPARAQLILDRAGRGEKLEAPAARPGQIIVETVAGAVRQPSLPALNLPAAKTVLPGQKLPHVIVVPDRLARRVFDSQPGSANAGQYFIRMPDGTMFVRPEPDGRGPAGRELFRFALTIKLAARRNARPADLASQPRLARASSGPVNSQPKPLSSFFDDDTLSAGDVVVAIEGFRVFKGSPDFPWRAADFVTVDRWQRTNVMKKGLREMERESGRIRQGVR